MSALTLKEALLIIDYDVITEEKVDMLINAVPEKEEQEIFLHY